MTPGKHRDQPAKTPRRHNLPRGPSSTPSYATQRQPRTQTHTTSLYAHARTQTGCVPTLASCRGPLLPFPLSLLPAATRRGTHTGRVPYPTPAATTTTACVPRASDQPHRLAAAHTRQASHQQGWIQHPSRPILIPRSHTSLLSSPPPPQKKENHSLPFPTRAATSQQSPSPNGQTIVPRMCNAAPAHPANQPAAYTHTQTERE